MDTRNVSNTFGVKVCEATGSSQPKRAERRTTEEKCEEIGQDEQREEEGESEGREEKATGFG